MSDETKDSVPVQQGDTPEKPRSHPVLVLFAGFLSAILLAACCMCGGAFWLFRPVMNEQPEHVTQLLQEIVDIQVPDAYQPAGTIEWNVAFTMSVRGVYFDRYAGDGVLTIVEVDSRFRSDNDVRRHIRRTLMEKGSGGTQLVVDDSETRRVEVLIRGQAVPFTIEIGRDPIANKAYHLVEGVFEGKTGEVLLALQVDEDHWDEQSVLDMLKSISTTPNEPVLE